MANETEQKSNKAEAKQDAASARSGSRILKQGTPFVGVLATAETEGPTREYIVKHGRICFGHVNGEPEYAYPGARVALTAAEAQRMLADKAIEPIYT